jgi:hypothetical protein
MVALFLNACVASLKRQRPFRDDAMADATRSSGKVLLEQEGTEETEVVFSPLCALRALLFKF